MKLFYSVNSPYARKCRVVILEKGLQERVEMALVNPLDNPPELIAVNPLCTVPALVTDAGLHLCDSTVICEYLDSLSPENRLYPLENRECVLAVAALADGIMDAAVACVIEGRRPQELQYALWVQRKEAAIARSIEKFAGISWEGSPLTIGTVSLAVALAYVSFRLPHIGWREKHLALAAWHDKLMKRKSFLETQPIPA